jgi:eukaryotic-like serine/threonine-protein kinase
VSDDTVLQFGQSLRGDSEPQATALVAPPSTWCQTCGSRFSPDGRFCPFDGTPLVAASPSDPSTDPLLGALIDGRYEVLSVIGEGGMGSVYEVRHKALGKRFALKALRKDLALDGEIAARFIQEARTAAAVSHPGLVEITDFGRLDSGQVYFVMELLEGQSLAALLRNSGPLPAARGLEIVRQIAHALKAAHDASIVHRDLKPDNIHVGRSDGERDRVKIVDFGLAKVIGASRLTSSGMVFGTPHYMSPEQAAGEVVDHRADIYALGVVMYEMFTGKVPFEADSYMGVLTKHMYMEPEPPSALSEEIRGLGGLQDVILRCLSKRPEARYDNLAALLGELGQLSQLPSADDGRSRGPDVVEPPPPPNAPPRGGAPRGAAWPWIVVGFAFLSGLSLVIVLRRAASSPRIVSTSAPVTPLPTTSQPPAAGTPASGPPSPDPFGSAMPPASGSVPARKPGGAMPRTTTPAPSKATKRRTTSGEIVDPWAR